jgi:prepilin-type N-terminal cleavage/methylation domain-containing protein
MSTLQPPSQNQNPLQTHTPKALDRPRVHCRKRAAGFTLVELLSVVAIIAVLAAILFPVAVSLQKSSSQSKAASNFRALGGVIMTYAAENDQSLPGFQANHRCAYRVNTPNQIGSVLYQQMGLPAPTKDFRLVPLLQVPALKKWLIKYSNGDFYGGAYSVTYQIEMPDGTKRQPFGWPASNTASMKIHQIPNPAKTWAVYELGGTGDPNPFVNKKYIMNQSSPRLWIFEGSYVGQASRLISKDFRTQTSDLEPTPRKARRTR